MQNKRFLFVDGHSIIQTLPFSRLKAYLHRSIDDMAQKFRTGSLVSVKGNMYPVLIVKGYDSSSELYTCVAGTLPSSYKMIAREDTMTQCPAGTVSPKSIVPKVK